VFTNGDRIHASRALKRLGIEDCFERVVCFETLNPTSPPPAPCDKLEIFDIMKHMAHPEPGVELPKSPILCKPSREAMLLALEVASINPQTTVSTYLLIGMIDSRWVPCLMCSCHGVY